MVQIMSQPSDYIEDLAAVTKAKAFLGREFLTWLWFEAETAKDRHQVALDGQPLPEFDLWVDDRLVLDGTLGMSHQNTMKGGDPSHSQEAAASLATGKTVRELKLGLNIRGHGEYSAVLSCEDLFPRGLKLPEPETDDGNPAPQSLAQRLQGMRVFLGILDGLFRRFLEKRVDASWESTALPAMRAWITQRQKRGEGGVLH